MKNLFRGKINIQKNQAIEKREQKKKKTLKHCDENEKFKIINKLQLRKIINMQKYAIQKPIFRNISIYKQSNILNIICNIMKNVQSE